MLTKRFNRLLMSTAAILAASCGTSTTTDRSAPRGQDGQVPMAVGFKLTDNLGLVTPGGAIAVSNYTLNIKCDQMAAAESHHYNIPGAAPTIEPNMTGCKVALTQIGITTGGGSSTAGTANYATLVPNTPAAVSDDDSSSHYLSGGGSTFAYKVVSGTTPLASQLVSYQAARLSGASLPTLGLTFNFAITASATGGTENQYASIVMKFNGVPLPYQLVAGSSSGTTINFAQIRAAITTNAGGAPSYHALNVPALACDNGSGTLNSSSVPLVFTAAQNVSNQSYAGSNNPLRSYADVAAAFASSHASSNPALSAAIEVGSIYDIVSSSSDSHPTILTQCRHAGHAMMTVYVGCYNPTTGGASFYGVAAPVALQANYQEDDSSFPGQAAAAAVGYTCY